MPKKPLKTALIEENIISDVLQSHSFLNKNILSKTFEALNKTTIIDADIPNNQEKKSIAAPQDDYLGHRQRLKKKYKKTGREALHDYEFLELLLSLAIPRKDIKPLAKKLIRKFGDIASVISAPPISLLEMEGFGENCLHVFKLFSDSAHYLLRDAMEEKTILSRWGDVCDYARLTLGHLQHEEFHIWFLDNHYKLIEDICASKGTLDHAVIYPREILKSAINCAASHVIFVHNHPSGELSPSVADIDMTAKLTEALKHANICVMDHIIISKKGVISFKNLHLI